MNSDEGSGANVRSNDLLGVLRRGVVMEATEVRSYASETASGENETHTVMTPNFIATSAAMARAADEIERLLDEVEAVRTGDTCGRMCEGAAYRIEARKCRAALAEIAEARGFDNIGNWARNRAKQAL